MNKTNKILIVDDHEMVRAGLRTLLSDLSDFKVIGESSNGIQALDFIESNLVDVVLMDINMPEMDGIACMKQISKLYPNVKVLALTMHVEEQHIKNMMRSGASGYILKNSSIGIIEAALNSIMDGKHYYSQEVTSVIMDDLANVNKTDLKDEILITQRELDVLILIVQEKTNHEIAEELFISVRTVDAHRRNLLEKTGAKNSVGLTKYAYKHNLMEG